MCGKRRTRTRNTVSPPWPESKTPIMYPRSHDERARAIQLSPRATVVRCLAFLPSLAPALRSRGARAKRCSPRAAAQGLTTEIASLGAHARGEAGARHGRALLATWVSKEPRMARRERACPSSAGRGEQDQDRRPKPPGEEAPALRRLDAAVLLGRAPLSRRSGVPSLQPPAWSLRRFGRGATPEQGGSLLHGPECVEVRDRDGIVAAVHEVDL